MVAQIPSLLEAFERYAKEQDVEHFEKLEEVMLDGLSIPVLGDLSFLKDCNVGLLSLNNCQVGVIDHPFPEGTKIERLELNSNNLIDRKSLEALGNLKDTLQELHLANNKFADLEALSPIHKLVNIRILNLIDNPVGGVVEDDDDEQLVKAAYREDLLKALPSLQALDGYDRNGKKVVFEDSEPEDDDEDAYTSESDEEEEEEEGVDDDDEGEDDEESPHAAKKRRTDAVE
ncbi:casein kinase ii beta chain, putative [Perkinsus marinus ATCC 50983]|uniref:Casein kinase ii beta chain, putative n=1 Tax=Perkinsus marinus (strain ATCC 50983 / TXsc) TaxID=423536 RepID=C5KH21_PERM5|nr:casein kinase ii beta chain, putative [Perkinsus marinus ATCC 50983]EER15883.1 casein kinase ii beta chain, putative [Perkinsus marinus ATCC 50983]|eukprot:XP_002784087.1 casein kinase ii beta chain, putative [Perkinsus marinus ATCC 50983]